MAALAYLLLPVSGLIAYFGGGSARTRFHGIQAVLYGVAWPALIYAASWVAETATRLVFIGGTLVWLLLIVATAAGKNPSMPGLARHIERWAADSPRDA
jgi:uncharacterized membrane protein